MSLPRVIGGASGTDGGDKPLTRAGDGRNRPRARMMLAASLCTALGDRRAALRLYEARMQYNFPGDQFSILAERRDLNTEFYHLAPAGLFL